MLENGFCEIDGVDPAEMKARKESPSPQKETIATNINPKGIGKPGSQQKKMRIGKKDEEQKC